MPTCAIYARVSDPSQVDGDSIEHQIAFVREFIRRRTADEPEPWICPDSLIYTDEGITGKTLMKRPEVQALIQGARDRKFDVVLFKGISRFARDTVDSLVMLRTLIAHGARVISLEENFDSVRDSAEFIFTIHSALAQAESEKIAIRVRIGAAEKARTGRWNGIAPDGYFLNRETQKLEIDHTMAATIQKIYKMYLKGFGCRRIVETLNGEGTYTKRGNLWTQRNVSRLLRNPVYVGDVVYGRTEQRIAIPDSNDPLSRRRRAVRVSDPEQLITCRDAHPPIVDRDTFARVQETMNRRRTTPGRTGKQHLLTKGILRCKCGSSMTIKYNGRGTAYYRCIGQTDKGKSFCDQKYIRAEDIVTTVLQRLKFDVEQSLVMDDVVLPSNDVPDVGAQLTELDRQIDREIHRTRLLFDRYSDGDLLDEQFTELNATIRKRITTLKSNRDRLASQQNAIREENDKGQFVKCVMNTFLSADTKDPQVTRQFIEALVREIRILPRDDDSTVDLHMAYRFASRRGNKNTED